MDNEFDIKLDYPLYGLTEISFFFFEMKYDIHWKQFEHVQTEDNVLNRP